MVTRLTFIKHSFIEIRSMRKELVPCLLFSLALGALSLCSGCRRGTAEAPIAKAGPPLEVKTVRPHKGEITRSITLPGEVKAYQQATLYAKVGGYLKKITVDKGDEVKEGDLLADIEVPEMLADLAKFKAEVEVAAVDYKRVSEAQKKAPDLVVPQTVDFAKAKYDIAKANLERTETLLSFARITAPFSGVVVKRMVDPGAFIPAATSGSAAQSAAILMLMDYSKVRVQVAVPEPEVPFIAKGIAVKVTVEELPARAYEGSVTRFAHALDEATKTMLAEVEIPNHKRELRPGMYALVKVVVERKTDAFVIPVEALVVEKVAAFVFTLVDNKAKKIPVKTGFNDGANVEIVGGANPDQPVILVGKQSLNDGQTVRVAEGK